MILKNISIPILISYQYQQAMHAHIHKHKNAYPPILHASVPFAHLQKQTRLPFLSPPVPRSLPSAARSASAPPETRNGRVSSTSGLSHKALAMAPARGAPPSASRPPLCASGSSGTPVKAGPRAVFDLSHLHSSYWRVLPSIEI